MKKLLPFLLFAFSGLTAQNLVINPGFEEYGTDAPFDLNNGFKAAQVKGWYQPTGGSSDYYRTGKNRMLEKDFLTRVTGPMNPNNGNCFAGFYGNAHNYCEYVGGSFAVPLEKGKKYKIGFVLALGSACSIGIPEIGVYLSKNKVEHKNNEKLTLKPQVIFDSTGLAEISGKWKLFSAEFIAEGKENFFVIGNFCGKTVKIPGKHPNNWAYYLLDDVFLYASDGEPVEIPVYNPEPEAPAGKAQVQKVESPSMNRKSIADSVEAGKTLVLRNIYFETDKSILLSESYPPLYQLLAELKKKPELRVEVQGHTDLTGTAEHNQQLSEDRAKAVADFLISNGIDPARVSWKGFGSSKPVSDSDHSLNRRVEFVFR